MAQVFAHHHVPRSVDDASDLFLYTSDRVVERLRRGFSESMSHGFELHRGVGHPLSKAGIQTAY
jgi:hypothetical protein